MSTSPDEQIEAFRARAERAAVIIRRLDELEAVLRPEGGERETSSGVSLRSLLELLALVRELATTTVDVVVMVVVGFEHFEDVTEPRELTVPLVAVVEDLSFSEMRGRLEGITQAFRAADHAPALEDAVLMKTYDVVDAALRDNVRSLAHRLPLNAESRATCQEALSALDARRLYMTVAREAGQWAQSAKLSAERALKDATAAASVGEHLREAAGEVAEGGLSAHFDGFAGEQQRRADRWAVAVFVLVGIAGFLAYWLFLVRPESSTELSPTQLVAHLALTAPALALAGYAASESRRHRQAANWSRSLAVQLKTLRAFTDSLAPDARNDVRRDFARIVFGQLEQVSAKDPVQASSLNVLHQALGAARSQR